MNGRITGPRGAGSAPSVRFLDKLRPGRVEPVDLLLNPDYHPDRDTLNVGADLGWLGITPRVNRYGKTPQLKPGSINARGFAGENRVENADASLVLTVGRIDRPGAGVSSDFRVRSSRASIDSWPPERDNSIIRSRVL